MILNFAGSSRLRLRTLGIARCGSSRFGADPLEGFSRFTGRHPTKPSVMSRINPIKIRLPRQKWDLLRNTTGGLCIRDMIRIHPMPQTVRKMGSIGGNRDANRKRRKQRSPLFRTRIRPTITFGENSIAAIGPVVARVLARHAGAAFFADRSVAQSVSRNVPLDMTQHRTKILAKIVRGPGNFGFTAGLSW